MISTTSSSAPTGCSATGPTRPGCLQARWWHRACAARRGPGHQPGAMGDHPRPDGRVLCRPGQTRASPDRTLFAVGDRKQSIYSFQGADPDIFELVHDEFKDRIDAAGQRVQRCRLHRFVPLGARKFSSAVDTVFKTDMSRGRASTAEPEPTLLHESNRRQATRHGRALAADRARGTRRSEAWIAPVDREPANSPRRKLARKIARNRQVVDRAAHDRGNRTKWCNPATF